MDDGGKTIVRPVSDTPSLGALPDDLFVSIEVIEGPDTGMRADITKTVAVIGRGAQVDIKLNDPTVSGTHATIEYVGTEFYVNDRNSSNGTFVNGEQIERMPVGNMDEIKFGQTKVLLSIVKDVYGTYMGGGEKPAEDHSGHPYADPNAITQVTKELPNPEISKDIRIILFITSGPEEGQKFMLKNQSTIIGRGEDVDIRINDEAVSRRHCQLMVRGVEQMGLKDLASTNGTVLNGKVINAVKVKHRDVFQIGGTKIGIFIPSEDEKMKQQQDG